MQINIYDLREIMQCNIFKIRFILSIEDKVYDI